MQPTRSFSTKLTWTRNCLMDLTIVTSPLCLKLLRNHPLIFCQCSKLSGTKRKASNSSRSMIFGSSQSRCWLRMQNMTCFLKSFASWSSRPSLTSTQRINSLGILNTVTASCRWRSTSTHHSTQVSASLLFQCGRCSWHYFIFFLRQTLDLNFYLQYQVYNAFQAKPQTAVGVTLS